LRRLEAALRADVDAEVIPGAVALVMRAGRLAFFESFGYADRNSHRPMRLDSVFRIASLTKPITVVAALMLLEEGKLLLTDPVSRYLPELGDVKVGLEEADASTGHRRLTLESAHRPMTVQDLMRHTA
jgi:CubicO group peptidase (beta-lactamase class C family)